MRELIAKFVMLLTLALAAPAALAQGATPDALLRTVADEVIREIGQGRESGTADAVKVSALVETRVLPLFDFARMTRLAVAGNWHPATPEQQRVIPEEVRTLLARTHFG